MKFKRLNRNWKKRQEAGQSDPTAEWLSSALSETRFSKLTLQVCWQRNLRDSNSIQEFLFPKLELLKDPYSLLDMKKAVERLAKARDLGEPLFVFGDYDVDGTSGAALLYLALTEFGFRVTVRQPDRFKDGYGLNVQAVEEAHRLGFKVLITVDCGISSFDAAQRAQELEIDLIVLDHHQIDPQKGIPAAYAVVNPQRPDCASGLNELCGCGVAFYLLRALRSEGRIQKWWPLGQEPNLKQHLDLLVLATAADMVSLKGDNHILVRHGLDVLKTTRKPGLKALMNTAGLRLSELSPSHLGFVLGPRINASGRMGTANLAFQVLISKDESESIRMAQELEKLNSERAEIQNMIWDQVKERVEQGLAQGLFQHGIVVGDSAWHEGVVGIVASRVTESFQKPAVILSFREDFAKGSARTWGGKNVLGALRSCHDLLLGYGGHQHAAGASVRLENFEAFQKKFNEAVAELKEEQDSLPLYFEAETDISELNLQTIQELEKLGPFGPGNPEPVFIVEAAIGSQKILKDRHLKLNLRSNDEGQKASLIEAIWFHVAEDKDFISSPDFSRTARWAAVPEVNRFRGNSTPTLRVKDRKPLTTR